MCLKRRHTTGGEVEVHELLTLARPNSAMCTGVACGYSLCLSSSKGDHYAQRRMPAVPCAQRVRCGGVRHIDCTQMVQSYVRADLSHFSCRLRAFLSDMASATEVTDSVDAKEQSNFVPSQNCTHEPSASALWLGQKRRLVVGDTDACVFEDEKMVVAPQGGLRRAASRFAIHVNPAVWTGTTNTYKQS